MNVFRVYLVRPLDFALDDFTGVRVREFEPNSRCKREQRGDRLW